MTAPHVIVVLLPMLVEFSRPRRRALPSATSDMFVGAVPNTFAPVFNGWNVWQVWQVRELDFSPLMLGLDRDRRFRIWVEDAIRTGAPETTVADPLALKGDQVQILPALPEGLRVAKSDTGTTLTKEHVPGDAFVVETQDQPPELRTVRFFNRGDEGKIVWPHDNNYMLDSVFQPDPKNAATQGPGPGTVTGGVTKPLGEGTTAVATVAALVAAALAAGWLLLRLTARKVAVA